MKFKNTSLIFARQNKLGKTYVTNWKQKSTETSIFKHFKQFGGNILFECNFREADIINHFNTVMSNYRNEIIWNNSNIRAGENPYFLQRMISVRY